MPTPTYPSLVASTLNRKWLFEVNTGTVSAPIWKVIGGVTNSKFVPDAAHFEDDSDMQSGGFGSQTKTAGDATATLTVARKTKSDGISYDDAQEFIRLRAIGQFGPSNSVQLRISEYTPGGGPRVEAYVGNFAAGWEPQGGANTNLDTAVITFMGQGQCAPITHPYPTTAAAPTLSSANPGSTGNPTIAAAGGVLVHIYGTSFSTVTGASGVTFGGTNATNYSVESDGLIIATAPAHAAGTVSLVVTNGTGASTGLNVVYA